MSNSFATPWAAAHQTPLSMGFPRQEYWSRLPFPSPGDLSKAGIEPTSPALQAFFTTEPPQKPSSMVQSVQSLSRVQLLATPWITACQASLSITNSQSLPKPMSVESVMPSNHLILCRPLLLLPPITPSITVFSNELTLHMRWPKYWSFQLQRQSFQ